MTQPKHRPQRQVFSIHVGTAAEMAVLPEWWGAIDSDVESRSLRYAPDGQNWIDEGQLPESFTVAGGRLSEVAAVMNYPGLASPSLEVGRRVLLKPDPQPQDRFAVAVWIEDGSQQVGFLPGDVAAEVMAESMRLRTGFGALVAAEVRDSSTKERRDVTILLGPGFVAAEESAEGS